MTKQEFADRFTHPEWQRKRLHIMNRDNFKCLTCESKTNTLNVHHRYYVAGRDIWDYPDVAFETLCKDCHKEVSKDDKGNFQKWEILLVLLGDDHPKILDLVQDLALDARELAPKSVRRIVCDALSSATPARKRVTDK